jgi:hypothetical protein
MLSTIFFAVFQIAWRYMDSNTILFSFLESFTRRRFEFVAWCNAELELFRPFTAAVLNEEEGNLTLRNGRTISRDVRDTSESSTANNSSTFSVK